MTKTSRSPRGLAAIVLLALWAFASNVQAEPPFDIRKERNAYANDLVEKEIDVTEKHNLDHDADGNVVMDDKQRRANAEYQSYRERRTEDFQRAKTRDNEVDTLMQRSGVGHDDWSDTGTPPGHKDYRGHGGDRDIVLNSRKNVDEFVRQARARGYTDIEVGDGYYKIRELDVVVWDPKFVEAKTGWKVTNPDPNRSFRQQINDIQVQLETENRIVRTELKGQSLDQQLRQARDPEFVAGHQKPGVSQQVKKVEGHLGAEPPDDPLKRREYVQELAKGRDQTVKAVDPDGRIGVVDQSTRRQQSGLKAGGDAGGTIYNIGDRPHAQKRKIGAFRDRVAETMAESLVIERNQRQRTIERMKTQQAVLKNQVGKARLQGNHDYANVRESKLRDHDLRLKRLLDQQIADDLTLKVVAKKNPAVAKKILAPAKTPDVKPPGLGRKLLKGYGLSAIGKGMGIFDAGLQEWNASADEKRPFNQAKMSAHALANVTGITQAVVSYEQVEYELGEGMKHAEAAEFERFRRLGIDVSKFDPNDPAAQKRKKDLEDLIRLRVTLRASVRAAWHGTKAIPFIGDIVGGAQDTWELTSGAIHYYQDTKEAERIQLENIIRQEENLQRGIRMAHEVFQRMKGQVTAAGKIEEQLERIKQQSDELTKIVEDLREQAAQSRQAIESGVELLEKLPSGETPAWNEQDAAQLAADMATATANAKQITELCEQAIEKVKSRKLLPENARELVGALTRRMQDADATYAGVADRWANLQRLQSRATTFSQISELRANLLENNEQLDTIADSLEDWSESIRKLARSHVTLGKQFAETDARMNRLVGYYQTRPQIGLNSNEMRELLAVRRQAIDLKFNDNLVEPFRGYLADVRYLISAARHTASSDPPEIPAQPAEIDAQLASKVAALGKQAAAMETAMLDARQKLQQLRALLSHDPTLFDLLVEKKGERTFRLQVRAIRPPQGAVLKYSWDFGDGNGGGPPNSTRTHTYARSGSYDVEVEVFETTPTLSRSIGKVSRTVHIDGPPSQPTSRGSLPSGDYWISHGNGDYSFGIDPKQRTVTLDLVVLKRQKMVGRYNRITRVDIEQTIDVLEGIFTYAMEARVEGAGEIDLQTGKFRIPLTVKDFDEGILASGMMMPGRQRYTYSVAADGTYKWAGMMFPGGIRKARQIAGFNPQGARLTGYATGTLDLQRGGGQVNLSLTGFEPRSFSWPPPGAIGISVRHPGGPIPAELRRGGRVRMVRMLLYPSAAEAKRKMQQFPNRIAIGDGARWQPNRFEACFDRVLIWGIGHNLNEDLIRKQLEHNAAALRAAINIPQR